MSSKIIFELCAETLQACIAARDGGADRIELCSALSEDGLTPSHGLIRSAIEHSGLPVHVLVRPRSGGFIYSEQELALMREDILHAQALGASGVVLGLLRTDATVDVERTQELVALAAPMEVTFHRAFDLTPSLDAALEDVIATGCHRLLTSGGKSDIVAGADNLRGLVERAAGRIQIAAGGGLRLENAASVAHQTGVPQVHGSLRRRLNTAEGTVLSSSTTVYAVDPKDVRAIVASLASLNNTD